MKNKLMISVTLLCLGTSSVALATMETSKAVSKTSKTEVIEARFQLKREGMSRHFEQIMARVDDEVKAEIKERIKFKEEKIAEAEKRAKEKKAADQTAEKKAQASEDQEQDQSNGRAGVDYSEKGRVNREYGQQLGNPNLTQEERQKIIQEKKNYNQNFHREHHR